jgi:hypothetical protein
MALFLKGRLSLGCRPNTWLEKDKMSVLAWVSQGDLCELGALPPCDEGLHVLARIPRSWVRRLWQSGRGHTESGPLLHTDGRLIFAPGRFVKAAATASVVTGAGMLAGGALELGRLQLPQGHTGLSEGLSAATAQHGLPSRIWDGLTQKRVARGFALMLHILHGFSSRRLPGGTYPIAALIGLPLLKGDPEATDTQACWLDALRTRDSQKQQSCVRMGSREYLDVAEPETQSLLKIAEGIEFKTPHRVQALFEKITPHAVEAAKEGGSLEELSGQLALYTRARHLKALLAPGVPVLGTDAPVPPLLLRKFQELTFVMSFAPQSIALAWPIMFGLYLLACRETPLQKRTHLRIQKRLQMQRAEALSMRAKALSMEHVKPSVYREVYIEWQALEQFAQKQGLEGHGGVAATPEEVDARALFVQCCGSKYSAAGECDSRLSQLEPGLSTFDAVLLMLECEVILRDSPETESSKVYREHIETRLRSLPET